MSDHRDPLEDVDDIPLPARLEQTRRDRVAEIIAEARAKLRGEIDGHR